jgi:glycosyltransferase involved in cell wall biosynthesis
MKLVWNAIVKNEAAIIERCVNSLLPHVDGAVIVDTGSTDGTPDKIMELFVAAGKPVEFHYASFVNFEQARNEALKRARESQNVPWDYLLLADADMEFRVHRPDWFNGGKELAYDLRQRGGSLGYYNRRLLSRAATGWYVGVTHEYLDVPATRFLDGAEFIDHADGANRPDKLKRDIALLETALATETRPGLIERYHFYLAGSYYDLGQFEKAADHYHIRTTLGGFAEEQWYAKIRYALCLKNQDKPAQFVWNMLQAYRMRPHRAESLYELANYFRVKGDNASSLLFSTPGMALPLPAQELLFVNEWIYKHGLREEFAICAYYDPRQRKKGADVCDDLVLQGSGQARGNQYWYLEPLVNHVPSFQPIRSDFDPPEGWVAMNPSIINDGGALTMLVRTVNYTITPEGRYEIRGTTGTANSTNPINTRNHLVYLDDELKVTDTRELHMPLDWPAPKYDLVIGFEDSRLFKHNGKMWTVSTVRELNEPGLCQQVVAPLNLNGYGDWTVFEQHSDTHEKNWMPWVLDGEIQFVHRLGSMIKMSGGHGFYRDPKIDPSRISGGSQVIKAEGINIALVHEANFIPGRPHNRFYQHRFVTFADDGGMLRISRPFYFHDRQIEFAAGLAYIPEKRQLVASYGIRDCEAWLATMDFDDVVGFIGGWSSP